MKIRSAIICMLLFVATAISSLFLVGTGKPTYALNIKDISSIISTGEIDTIPEAYCLKDEYVIFAQNQDAHGYCWNFAATMAASTTLMRATNEYYDLSELWFGVAARVENNHSIGSGGSFTTQNSAMVDTGIVLEVDLPYQNSYTLSNENAADYYNFYSKYVNDDLANCLSSVSYNPRTEGGIAAIKEHIYRHGSLYLAFNFKTGFIPAGEAYYKPPNQSSTNGAHAVSVVGWDDNFTQTLTINNVTKEFKGAWIILNSYTETSGREGLSFIFYEDTNIYSGSSVYGYKYEADTEKDFYFYDRIEEGYAYPINIKGKYYGDFVGESALSKQKNIFYDDVNLVYSYLAPDDVTIDVQIYLGDRKVTDDFDIEKDDRLKRFSISAQNAEYGQYKILVTYTDGNRTDTFLNNFFVTYGLIGESVEFKTEDNDLGFRTPRDLEFLGYAAPDKNYVIYTNKLSGNISFVPIIQSVYSDKNMSIASISYEITDGKSCVRTHTVEADSGSVLTYTFNIIYCADTSMQPVNVYYDLGGGINHSENYEMELASETSDLMLEEPTREGYTFKGWYLDYGNGSRALEEIDGKYYIDWEDIHHMGENPSVFALSHYKRYYLNSNIVFVYARWEEVEYYNVELIIHGSGSSQITEAISVSEDDVFKYVFKIGSGKCLSRLEINGVAVGPDELVNIAQNGLRLENINQDTTIDAYFDTGCLLYINTGDNIKAAYVSCEENGQTVNYYNGEYFSNLRRCKIVVEVKEDDDGYTYLFENAASYTALGNGVFTRDVIVYARNGIISIEIGSAVPRPKQPVEIEYEVNEYVLNHYLSSNKNAIRDDASHLYATGDIVYLFINIPTDTVQYNYCVPSGFEPIGRYDWYRQEIVVDPENPDLGIIAVTQELKTYTVTWKNWDGSVLWTESYEYGTTPEFDGLPIRPESEQYIYTFANWSPSISPVTSSVEYTAEYFSELKSYTVTWKNWDGSVLDTQTYNYGDTPEFDGLPIKEEDEQYTYTFANWSPSITSVTSNVEYIAEYSSIKKSFNVNIVCGDNGTSNLSGVNLVNYGEGLNIEIKAAAGYKIDYIKIDGEIVENSKTLLIENVTEDMVVEVAFKKILTTVGKVIIAITTITMVSSSIAVMGAWYKKRRNKPSK